MKATIMKKRINSILNLTGGFLQWNSKRSGFRPVLNGDKLNIHKTFLCDLHCSFFFSVLFYILFAKSSLHSLLMFSKNRSHIYIIVSKRSKIHKYSSSCHSSFEGSFVCFPQKTHSKDVFLEL